MWSEKMGIANVQLLEGVEPPYLFRKDLCKYTIVSMFQFFDIVQNFPSVSEPYFVYGFRYQKTAFLT